MPGDSRRPANCEACGGVELAAAADTLRTLRDRRDRLREEMQQTTAEVQAVLAQGNDLLARLRAGVRSRYGIHDDRLREFGIKPCNGRKQSRARTYTVRQETGPARNPAEP
ncbi:MAG: hypothetical protein ACJ76Y_22620 [Thermoanaerobaculia bacterium]